LYKVSVTTHFDAAHQLNGYEGPCQALHGHTWKVRVDVVTGRKDEVGISLDFKELKSITHQVLDRFDHKYINQVAPFDHINPTAENLSAYIFDEIEKLLPDKVSMSEVTVWESESYAISYSR